MIPAILLALLPVPHDGPPRPPDDPLAFVYVEANVNGASGGHLALWVDDFVYHFQQAPGSLLGLVRERWPVFRHSYAGLQNRNLHVTYLDVPADQVARVADRFAARYVRQQTDADRLRRCREDLDWWEALATGSALPPLRGVGLLNRTGEATDGGVRLRTRLEASRGAGALEAALRVCERRLSDWTSLARDTDLEAVREVLQEREALRALVRGSGVGADASLPDHAWSTLSGAELTSLVLFQEHLLGSIDELLDSARPDRGLALLRAVARYHAVDRSIQSGRLVLLDAFPAAVESVAPITVAERWACQRSARRGREVLALLRASILDGRAVGGEAYQRLEEAATRCHEFQRAAEGQRVRVAAGRLLPSRAAAPTWSPGPVDPRASLDRARQAAARAEETWQHGRGYDLFRRNCVTELVAQLNASFEDPATARAVLGECLQPGAGVEFVPFVLHDRVRASLRVAATELIPAYRLRERVRRRAEDPGAWTDWRERTTLLSEVYTPRQEDGAFLLFTDDVLWRRPLFGAVNLVYATGQSLTGVLTAPFDGGRRVKAGLSGALFSFPELAFGNIRKGTFGYVPPGR